MGSSFGKTFRVAWPDNLQSVFSSVAVFNFDVISLPGPACIVARSRPALVADPLPLVAEKPSGSQGWSSHTPARGATSRTPRHYALLIRTFSRHPLTCA